MEMSAHYMRETVAFLATKGYNVTTEQDEKRRDEQLIFVRERHTISRGAQESFLLETLTYPDQTETYFLEIKHYFALHSFSFPLDSWKHRPEKIEFKYYTHPETGLGLSFILSFPNEP